MTRQSSSSGRSATGSKVISKVIPASFSRPDAPLFVRIDSFGESSINVMVYCFVRTTDWSEWLRIKENLVYDC